MTSYTLFFDGACEPKNPGGVASYGYALDESGQLLQKGDGVVGEGPAMTNNVAEYHGLIVGLEVASKRLRAGDELRVVGDSQLVIRQMRGEYKVSASRLVPLHRKAKELVSALSKKGVKVSFEWVAREENEVADRLSHEAFERHRRGR
ncbi:MAG: ribonuclease HI family protein [Candidatus Thorarchaeota archaeon]|nr:ribonuclease HI family protein [Candidatus Thorarchaeota archaeon]